MSGVANENGDVEQDGLLDVLPAGTSLRGYELKSILGHGGFGITYRARDVTLDRYVAIKEYLPTNLAVRRDRTTVLPRSPAHAEQFVWGRERFLEEARTLGRLDRTPGIVRVYDFLEANGTAYMVMALVEGENLNKRLMREGRLTPEAVDRLLFPLLDGLEEVHAIGFLHRDIKPANIMVDARGRPTLIDFGAARAAMAGRSTTMTAIFTPGYAAAEQYASAELGPWTDIYGLSATLYHAITGNIPPSSINRILNDTYEPLSELKPEGYAPELLAGIDAGMISRGAERPQSIVEWRHALRTGERQAVQQAVTQVLHKPRRRTRRSGIILPRPVLWGAAAAVAVLLAGGGYLAFTAGPPATVNTAALSLSAEQLEQALAERRKADTLAAEKRRLEDEARQKAEAESAAKRQAEAELDQARQARQKAEDELAALKADIEARRQSGTNPQGQAEAAKQRAAEEDAQRKAEAEAASLRQTEDEAGKRAAADAEAKRQADQALAMAEAQRKQAEADAHAKAEAEAAARRQASEEDQRKAEAEAATRRQADEAQAKAQAAREKAEAEAKIKAEADKAAKLKDEAETAEKALRLELADRQRLQVALTSLGFDTRGSDGVLGLRSREMIAGWQKKAGAPATGFLTAAQRDELLRTAAPAVARWEEERKKAEEQKKLEDDKKKSDAAQAGMTPASPSPPTQTAPALATASPPSAFDGTYRSNKPAAPGTSFTLAVTNGRGSLTMSKVGCNVAPMAVTISPAGEINGQGELGCPLALLAGGAELMLGGVTVRGRTSGGNVTLTLSSSRGDLSVMLNRGASPPAAAPAAAQPSVAAVAPAGPSAPPDGLWRGTYSCVEANIYSNTPSLRDPQFTTSLNMQLANGSGSWKSSGPIPSNGFTQEIRVSAGPTEATVTRIHSGQSYMGGSQAGLSGQYDGNAIRASGREKGTGRYCTFVLTRA